MTAYQAHQILSGRLRFGDPEQIEALHYLRRVRQVSDCLERVDSEMEASTGKPIGRQFILDALDEFGSDEFVGSVMQGLKNRAA